MAAISDVPHTRASNSIHTSPVMLPDPENMGLAVESTLLASDISIQAEVFSCTIPVIGVYL